MAEMLRLGERNPAPYPNDGSPAPERGDGYRAGSALRFVTHCLEVQSTRAPQFIDITDDVEEIVRQAGAQNGVVVVFSPHTTAAVRINENEPCLIRDMEKLLARLAPPSQYYEHNDLSVRTVNVTEEEDANGHSHCLHMLMGASEAIPLVGGRLLFGRWQRVFLIELDKPRRRQVMVQLIGT